MSEPKKRKLEEKEEEDQATAATAVTLTGTLVLQFQVFERSGETHVQNYALDTTLLSVNEAALLALVQAGSAWSFAYDLERAKLLREYVPDCIWEVCVSTSMAATYGAAEVAKPSNMRALTRTDDQGNKTTLSGLPLDVQVLPSGPRADTRATCVKLLHALKQPAVFLTIVIPGVASISMSCKEERNNEASCTNLTNARLLATSPHQATQGLEPVADVGNARAVALDGTLCAFSMLACWAARWEVAEAHGWHLQSSLHFGYGGVYRWTAEPPKTSPLYQQSKRRTTLQLAKNLAIDVPDFFWDDHVLETGRR